MGDFLSGGGYEQWLGDLGVTDAPLTRRGLTAALRFFHLHMPGLPRRMQFNFLKAMDLHKPVHEVLLAAPDMLSAFRKCNEDPVKLFYTRSGVGVDRLALNPAGREFRRYRVVRPSVALQSVCAPAWDTWSDERLYFEGRGGGISRLCRARDMPWS